MNQNGQVLFIAKCYSFTFNRREIQNLELFETYLTEKETYLTESQNDSLRGITNSVKAYEI